MNNKFLYQLAKIDTELIISDSHILGSLTPLPGDYDDYFERYEAKLYFDKHKLSSILIKRPINIDIHEEKEKDYFFNRSNGNIISKPFIYAQDTALALWGKGLAGHLIKMTNNIYSPFFKSPLYSDTEHLEYNWNGKIVKPAVRVWEKLVKEEVAEYVP